MKYLKLYENNSNIKSILKNIENYNKDVEYLKPILITLYEEQYSIGDNDLWALPDDKNMVNVYKMEEYGGLIIIAFVDVSSYLDGTKIYEFEVSVKELEEGIIKYESNKYNL